MTQASTHFDKLLSQISIDQAELERRLAKIREPKKQYIIYMTPRTGSSWLRDLLRSTNILGWPEEWLNTHLLTRFSEKIGANSLETYTRMQKGRCQSPNGVYGITMTWRQIATLWPDVTTSPTPTFLQHFPVTKTTAFSLYRRDIVAQAVSTYRVTKTGLFDNVNASAEQHALAEADFYYDEVVIRKWLKRIAEDEKRLETFFSAHNIKPQYLVYEDMTAANPNDVAQFFVEAVTPGESLIEESSPQSRHTKLQANKNKTFAERFYFDNMSDIEQIQKQRRHIFEKAHYFCKESDDDLKAPGLPPLLKTGSPDPKQVSVIIPVYAGLASVKKCLKSVLRAPRHPAHRIIVIYDHGPEPQIEALLDELARSGLIELYKNTENLGFVRTVNRGFDLAGENDVIILNSDTEVPPGWIERMADLAASDPHIATITPYTNNGEICSFPAFGQSSKLPYDMDVDTLDKVFQQHSSAEAADIPTGVGFCMYIRRAALHALGSFNAEAFGRGYGEENDFCLRAEKAGWRNVIQPNLFVYHEGNVSFGEDRKALVKKAVETVEALHPGYNFAVQKYIHTDPMRAHRFELVLRYLSASAKPLVLIIAHGEGGGTRRYINELRNYFRDTVNFLWLEPTETGWVRLLFQDWASTANREIKLDTHKDALVSILKFVGIDAIHINHVKGIAKFTSELIDALKAPYIVTLHDYYFIGVNPTLTDAEGKFAPESAWRTDVETTDDLTLATARSILAGARKVMAPSQEAADIYYKVLPSLVIDVVEHLGTEIIEEFPPVRIREHKPQRKSKICVIGALGLEKGADLLEAVADLAKKSNLEIEFHLIGYAYRTLSPAIRVHGSYGDRELQEKLRNLDADLIWFPCQWPETYSYTLTAALDAGAPVLAPSLGAFKSRTAGRPYTWLVDFHLPPTEHLNYIQNCLQDLKNSDNKTARWTNQPQREKYYTADKYAPPARLKRTTPAALPDIEVLKEIVADRAEQKSGLRSYIAPILWRLRANRSAARIWFKILPDGVRSKLRRILMG